MSLAILSGTDPVAFAELERAIFTNPWPAASFTDGEDRIVYRLCEPHRCLGYIYGRATLDEAELWRIAVADELRRQGWAARLFRAFRDTAWLRGAERLFLEVSARNRPAIAFYRAMGFAEIGRRRAYYGPAEDAVLMRAEQTEP